MMMMPFGKQQNHALLYTSLLILLSNFLIHKVHSYAAPPVGATTFDTKVRGTKSSNGWFPKRQRRRMLADDTDGNNATEKTDPPVVPQARKMGSGSGKGGSTSTSSSSHSGSSSTKSKGKGMSKSKSRAKGSTKSTSGSMMKSNSRSSSASGNIFDHTQGLEEQVEEFEPMPVQCGTEEIPFLTTFVASIQLQHVAQESRKSQPASRKESKKSSKNSRDIYDDYDEDSDDDDDDEGDQDELSDLVIQLPTDQLTHLEQRLMEAVFREVYNGWAFINCDGFFRKVYTVSMTLVERDDDSDEYSVTLEDTYRMNGMDDVDVSVANGTLMGAPMKEELLHDLEASSQTNEGLRWLQETMPQPTTTNNVSSTPQKYMPDEEEYTPTTYAQTISGGDDVPIYYVSFAATCRNCQTTPQINFPLLEHPDEEDHDGETRRQRRKLQNQNAFRTSYRMYAVEPEEEDTCTCPVEVNANEEEIARQRRRLDGHEDLMVPDPNGPTAQEFIQAMNAAIKHIQETEGELLRVAGIVDLIEPDYFQGENPPLIIPPTSAPTISPMPTSSPQPSVSPTMTPQPTVSPQPSTFISVDDDQLAGNDTVSLLSTEVPLSPTLPPITSTPTLATPAPTEDSSATLRSTTIIGGLAAFTACLLLV